MAVSLVPLQIGWRPSDPPDALLAREWLVTNGLGGYASGTIGGACTRRFHGKLIAALPAPLGRFMMLNHLEEWLTGPGGLSYKLSSDEFLQEFALEEGLPVWRYARSGIRLEKRVVMPHRQNTTYIVYRLLDGMAGLTLNLRPSVKFRSHGGLLNDALPTTWSVQVNGRELEIEDRRDLPSLRMIMLGESARLENTPETLPHVIYRLERSLGYEYEGALWSPGIVTIDLRRGEAAGLIASVEQWDVMRALGVDECFAAESERRRKLLAFAGSSGDDNFSAELVLASDQFLVVPSTRAADDARTIIAGYHWFTDWGRDTMISLEGLTLVTGRYREAGSILRTFASYIRNGLIPNMFPEGEHGGLYHTADATMWFFHAIWRYLHHTNDRETLRMLLPKLVDIIEHHVRGTQFNIHVDPDDGLLAQGAEGYQLTWMDAKVDGWVVTPRRGKAVEINALYYNALRILQELLHQEGDGERAEWAKKLADQARLSFNKRFWYEEGQYLYDVIDPDDAALRPNQIFAVSLDYPVLDRARWSRIVEVVQQELLTPVGLRSLGRRHLDYKAVYDGDLHSRDAAYHQGTVWAWLIGPFIDAWLRVHPEDGRGARAFLEGFEPHLGEACIGTISEIFDAEPPYAPRGCAAQAWSVAEVLRSLVSVGR